MMWRVSRTIKIITSTGAKPSVLVLAATHAAVSTFSCKCENVPTFPRYVPDSPIVKIHTVFRCHIAVTGLLYLILHGLWAPANRGRKQHAGFSRSSTDSALG